MKDIKKFIFRRITIFNQFSFILRFLSRNLAWKDVILKRFTILAREYFDFWQKN